MNQLSHRDRELVSLGAAIASNCIPCIDHHLPLARNLGLTEFQLREAIELADQVRQVPARNVLLAAQQQLAAVATVAAERPPLPEAAQCTDLSQHSAQCC